MTTCAFIQKDDISITTFNISAILLFEKINDESCKIENYQVIIQNGVSTIITPNKVEITNIKPYTNYSVNIISQNLNKSLSLEFKTEEGASLAPENIFALWDNRYRLFLTWNHPDITNGPLKKFEIQIITRAIHIANYTSLICFNNTYNVEKERYKYTFNSSITFESEECYSSTLIISIIPFNTLYGSPGILIIRSPPRTPFFSEEPFVESLSNTTIILKIPKPQNLSDISYMYILMADAKLSRRDQTIEQYLETRTNFELIPELIANINLTIVAPPSQFIIGNNACNISSDSPVKIINSGTTYTIKIILLNTYKNFTRFTAYTLEATTTGQKNRIESVDFTNYAVLSCLLLLLIPLVLWIYIRKCKNKMVFWGFFKRTSSGAQTIANANVHASPLLENNKHPEPEHHYEELELHQVKLDKLEKKVKPDNRNMPNFFKKSQYAMLIHVTEFEKYVQRALADGELEKQYQLFPQGQTKPWEYGALPQNTPKNRYNHLIAYDYTRVKLEKLNDDPHSDYINANYIDGYKCKKAYIATQEPKVATVNDFWRMIWQENVTFIVMLDNITEEGKKRNYQYWPNINQNIRCGDIEVEYVSTKEYIDYHHRTFLLTNNGIKRTVEQFHFISWPVHGVPLYTQSLVPLMRELQNTPYGKSPIVVHCSTGTGRTGTIILCNICVRMAIREKCINVLKYQYRLIGQRTSLVDNLEQYKLVHMLLIEYLINPNTVIKCDKSTKLEILHLLQSEEYEKQLQDITQKAWQDQALRTVIPETTKPNPGWISKNRFQDIVPEDHCRVHLTRYPATEEHSEYINAVKVDGFRAPKKFIVTQQPLPHTICDFWRMVDAKGVHKIILLNKIDRNIKDCCIFWPTNTIKEIAPVPYLTVEFIEKSSNEFFSIIKLRLHNDKDKKQPKRNIELIKFKCWLAEKSLPNSTESLIQLWKETEKRSSEKSPIIISCYNGARASGLFVAFMFVLEKIKVEQECDVCLAVRSVRLNRMQFIENSVQFVYLYQAALDYISTFNLYANFT